MSPEPRESGHTPVGLLRVALERQKAILRNRQRTEQVMGQVHLARRGIVHGESTPFVQLDHAQPVQQSGSLAVQLAQPFVRTGGGHAGRCREQQIGTLARCGCDPFGSLPAHCVIVVGNDNLHHGSLQLWRVHSVAQSLGLQCILFVGAEEWHMCVEPKVQRAEMFVGQLHIGTMLSPVRMADNGLASAPSSPGRVTLVRGRPAEVGQEILVRAAEGLGG